MPSTNGFAMNGGDGEESYKRNSTYQRRVIDNAKPLVQESIAQHIRPLIANSPSLRTLCIADLGCSVGPNTFIAVENILEAVDDKTLEFQVHFSDQIFNDFNTLFKSLPPNLLYHASGVPGSFHGRLFPRASVHIVHCATALHWLSRPPPVANRGRIFYLGAAPEVVESYARQHAEDVAKFLDARAREVVPGGLVILVLPARQESVPHSRVTLSVMFDMLGDCLMDMAKEGIVDEKKVDEFNCPMYFTSPQELEDIVKENGHFSVERMEGLPQVKGGEVFPGVEQLSVTIRAALEDLMRNEFEKEMLDRIFNVLYPQKLVEGLDRIVGSSSLYLFVLLKRKQEDHIL